MISSILGKIWKMYSSVFNSIGYHGYSMQQIEIPCSTGTAGKNLSENKETNKTIQV